MKIGKFELIATFVINVEKRQSEKAQRKLFHWKYLQDTSSI
jgi:hypothetical protein